MGVNKMTDYTVTAVYESGQRIIVKHSTLESALATINVINHNAKIENERVTLRREWE